MFLKVRPVIALVIFFRIRATKIREPNGRLQLLQPGQGKAKFEIQATRSKKVRQRQRVRGKEGPYVSIIEQCQKTRRVKSAWSACPVDEALGWLGHVSQ